MKDNPLLEIWEEGSAAVGAWCASRDSLVAEVIASTKPDYVCIDMQHGGTGFHNLPEMIQAVRSGGSTPLVRVPEGSLWAVNKSLDLGAAGVIVPLVESSEQAARAVAACRFPPEGKRSYGPIAGHLVAAAQVPEDLQRVALIVMVETRQGLSRLEEICAVDGVDCVYIGPADVSIALGLAPGAFDAPEFQELMAGVLTVCRQTGVVAGIHTYDGSTASRFLEMGFGMVTVGVDLRTLRHGFLAALGATKQYAAE